VGSLLLQGATVGRFVHLLLTLQWRAEVW